MKQINLIVQSKGGVGKSLLLWFIAQIEKDNKSIFIDLDESTQTSSNRLEFLGEGRVKAIKILDANKKLEREKILDLFETLSKTKATEFFIDFGAPESQELLKVFTHDIDAQTLAEALTEMGVKLRIFVVIAGRDALRSCMDYYTNLHTSLDGKITVFPLINEGTLGGIEKIEELKTQLENKLPYYPFGGLGEAESGKSVINIISTKKSPETLNFTARLAYKKGIKQVEAILSL